MADRALTAAGSRSRWWSLPAAARVGILYLPARLVTLLFFVVASGLSHAGSRFGLRPSVGDLLNGWDAQWYWLIAQQGYPSTLPTDAAGHVTQNAWAFMPVYPYLVRLVGGAGAGWPVAAVVVSLVAGFVASYVLYRMLAPRVGRSPAMWAVVFFANAPLAAVFQIGYAEALFLVWLFLALWAAMARRYAWLYVLIPLMGFTRPGVLAFALFLGLHGLVRLRARRREPLRRAHVVHILLGGLLAVAVGVSWQLIAGRVTGRADAYFATELSWRRGWLPGPETGFVPFGGSWQAAQFWARTWGLPEAAGPVLLLLVVGGAGALLLWGRGMRRVGSEVRLWSASYLVYLAAVFFPQSSVFRLLVPVAPMWGGLVPRRRGLRPIVLVGCLAAQAVWIVGMYAYGNTYWEIP